ncbi:shikimate kinase [Flavobacterium sp.]|uniref:shikimate kinase n=1 Tax=Flavobacterium sp. TaxID=239 RepID=UPI00286CF92B|nr:shikimate kinase [Flavobacterium sp.]
MKKIVLVGYMGSGKSVIGRFLAKDLDLPFYDLDNLIVSQTSKSINEIFAEHGEIYFRKLEHEIFKQTLLKEKSFVLSLGGGTVCYANNHEFLKAPNVTSIYLKASIATLVVRLENQLEERPLLKTLSGEELYQYVASHLFERSYYYNQCKFVISVDDKTPEQIISEIEDLF